MAKITIPGLSPVLSPDIPVEVEIVGTVLFVIAVCYLSLRPAVTASIPVLTGLVITVKALLIGGIYMVNYLGLPSTLSKVEYGNLWDLIHVMSYSSWGLMLIVIVMLVVGVVNTTERK